MPSTQCFGSSFGKFGSTSNFGAMTRSFCWPAPGTVSATNVTAKIANESFFNMMSSAYFFTNF